VGTFSSRSVPQTLNEILSQPQAWQESLDQLRDGCVVERLTSKLSTDKRWLFLGCGTSYYLAQAASATWRWLGGRAASAPASELLLYPDLTLESGGEVQPVLISRSGLTSEVLQAAEVLNAKFRLAPIGISCAGSTPLQARCAETIVLPAADEKSMVMTRSFTSMLLALQYLAGHAFHAKEFIRGLEDLPRQCQALLKSLPETIREFAAHREFSDAVFLGQGPFHAIAQESTLKLTEMSCSYAQSFHTLEFRHGPRAVAAPDTLVTFFLSQSGYAAEAAVLEDIRQSGAALMVIVNQADEAIYRAADLVIELDLTVPEFARLAPTVIPAQLLGLYTALARGLDPDQPRNLTRVVTLNQNSTRESRDGS
jgi:glutamine---fructose-6-phosphate transaminase (isomerizing)